MACLAKIICLPLLVLMLSCAEGAAHREDRESKQTNVVVSSGTSTAVDPKTDQQNKVGGDEGGDEGSAGDGDDGNTSDTNTSTISGNNTSPSIGTRINPAGTKVIGLFSGFLSCLDENPDLAALTNTFYDVFSDDDAADVAFFVHACYASDPNTIYYHFSSRTAVESSSLAVFITEFERELSAVPDAVLHMVGHSYGGWTVMKLAQELASEVNMGRLATLDPISVVNCTPQVYLQQLSNPAILSCRQAPTDFTAMDLSVIKSRFDSWTNYYQDQDVNLHSSSIENASENIKKEYGHNGFVADMSLLTDFISAIFTTADE